MDSYPYLTEVIATFHSFNVFGTAIGKYFSIVLIILLLIFFFNKNIACISSVLAFIVNASNLIIKSTMYFFLYLKVLIFHSTSTTLLLLLNVVLTSLTNLFQSWVLSSSSIWSIFFCTYISAMLSLSQTSTVVILSLVAVTLLLLRNKQIFFHQSSNFVQSPSNYPRSRIILFSITVCSIAAVTVMSLNL